MSTTGVDARSVDTMELQKVTTRPSDSISNSSDTGKESRRNSHNAVIKEADENEPLPGRNFAEHEGKANRHLINLTLKFVLFQLMNS